MAFDATIPMAATLPQAQTRMSLDSKLKKSASEPMWDHQSVLPQRNTPHPNDAAMNRWPKPNWTCGGVIDPTDMRRHASDFGYRQLRFKPLSKEPKYAPEMTLEEVRLFLTKRYGSLNKAFDAMDFFHDGSLSAVVWREGIYNALATSFGTELSKYRMAIVPRRLFNERMQKLFTQMDVNHDGLIQFEEFIRPYLGPAETSRDFTRRRQMETTAHTEEKQVAMQRKMKGVASKAAPDNRDEISTLRDFAVYLLKGFKDVNEAFEKLDVDKNGQLSMAEFKEGARRIKYEGDVTNIFRLLDADDTGTISKTELRILRQLPNDEEKAGTLVQMTKKNIQPACRVRSPIQNPPAHRGGVTLSSLDISRPLGERMKTAAGFHTFARSATGRLDDLVHPSEYPGTDPQNFCSEHGPGFVDKGPEYFPYLGETDHPMRGTKWKSGAFMNRTARFGPSIPSKQGRADREHASASYNTHEGFRSNDGFKVCNTGGISWARSPGRAGIR